MTAAKTWTIELSVTKNFSTAHKRTYSRLKKDQEVILIVWSLPTEKQGGHKQRFVKSLVLHFLLPQGQIKGRKSTVRQGPRFFVLIREHSKI